MQRGCPKTEAPRPGAARWARPLVLLGLTGCAHPGAPSFALFGAYFPAWMLCVLLGIAASIGARVLFVATGLAGALPFQLFVCMSIGLCFALLAWLSWFA
ncbi:YtcA family lipoprotein [Variovorax sp. J31P207]|uniref:YtcA family lipoprotein n=1 Tax=Variovorax sp. J31P207 TaxID=3053510 RepID=UPI0025763931|nr:YtcA family lipoprotein [Variovorax sp. J31P207]MDM0070518.1 YtcA family lipoprotein [Variovorax sp. J31P207]